MTVTFRDLQKKDYSEFSAMSAVFYDSNATLHSTSKEKIRKVFDASIQINPYLRALIIEVDGAVAGYAHLSFTHSNEVAGMVLLIEELYVKPEYQGRGIGNQFFDWLFQEYDGKIKRYRLEVTKVNDGAIRLYEKRNFQLLDYVQMVYDVEEEA